VAAVERRREERIDERVELRRAARGRDGHVAQVAAHIEGGVVFPARPVEVEDRSHRTLPVAFDRAQPLRHRGDERLEGDRAVEEGDAPDVQALVRSLQVQEGRVQWRETAHLRHGVISRSR
jgi:hypothetical protein